MITFIRETSTVVTVPGVNCDTDQIIPARFLRFDRAQGYDQFLFHDIRRDTEGNLDPEFPLNRPNTDKARILLVEDNFGCGSSREGAVYALIDAGFRALIAPSFGDIFYNNALKNGLIPVRLPAANCQALADYLKSYPESTVTVDLEREIITLPCNLGQFEIKISAFARECILAGLDEIAMTFSYIDQIKDYEKNRMHENPWLNR